MPALNLPLVCCEEKDHKGDQGPLIVSGSKFLILANNGSYLVTSPCLVSVSISCMLTDMLGFYLKKKKNMEMGFGKKTCTL